MTDSFSILTSEIECFTSEMAGEHTLVVAFSGGLDSMVLLHILSQTPSLHARLHAIHINHQLQSHADEWGEHCREFCLLNGIEFTETKVDIGQTQRQGLESVARKRRYEALTSVLQPGDFLLTAHHQRDQAETFLLNLARGAGVNGLASMPYKKTLSLSKGGQACLIRPLIKVPYDELRSYAETHRLQWVEDPSNNDTDLRRNLIRHKILPEFRQAWSNIDAQIERSAQHMQEAHSLLQGLAEQQLQARGYGRYQIDLNRYDDLDWVALKNLLRHWSESVCGFNLGFSQLQWIHKHGFEQPSTKATLKLPVGELRIYRKNLYYHIDSYADYSISLSDLMTHFNHESCNEPNYTLRLSKTWYQQHRKDLIVRNIRKSDGINRNTLKKWFQTHAIPPWIRPYWPVLCLNDKMLSIWGMQGDIPEAELQSSLQKQKHEGETIAISLDDDMIHTITTKQITME
ncbi:tRNA lysidine(34) synthetase TilS [Thiomicrorhabdus sp. ZW0627]|uniref:tRNA lysidine(34) synthetase TilS n=1 Tax=Thiomicrorhabdus sp. ZW0627 TaxID=3039774 RepID=UPI002436BA70|nr:tRNA lysidine(34) synthetase TilS [Thiomicrorhabdus sp. ZW0627]MDG6772980.1 tRNA lysidine(34) synthetase TilS [Thiomicrorhabdus sp. ZW0627]